MRNRCLILSVSRKVSLIQAFRSAGWNVTGQDLDPNAIALKFCDEIAKDNQENGPYDLILATSDRELRSGTFRPSDETIDICTDKFKFYKWCKANGFLTPEVYFVKPRVSSSGKEVECVWQEMLEGEEYSIDCYCSLIDGTPISIVPRKRVKVVNGESTVSVTVANDTLIKETLRLITELKLVGINCIQCFISKDSKIYFIDLNLRAGGGTSIGIAAGCHYPSWMLQELNGEQLTPKIGEYKVGLMGRSYSEWEFDGCEI